MKPGAITYIWIGLGSALGGVARFGCGQWAEQAWDTSFPWGTLLVNVTGSLLIGLLAVLSGPDGRLRVGPNVRQFAMTGFCGGFTTFSAFSLQTLELIERQALDAAAINIVASSALCLLSVWVGASAASLLNRWLLAKA